MSALSCSSVSPMPSKFCALAAQYRELDTEYRSSPDDILLTDEMRIVRATISVQDQMAQAPISSLIDAAEAMALLEERFKENPNAGAFELALVRNVALFMSGK